MKKLLNVRIGGIKQSIYVAGENNGNPLILMLHGGPGYPLMPFSHIFHKLEKEFIVAYWDQRGAGKTYSEETPSNTMNLETFIKDTYEVIQFLKAEYGKERIFLAGHSWGSILGINIAYQHPSEIYAYIGISQVANYVKGNNISYQFALKTAKEKNMADMLEKLIELGEPPYKEAADMSLLSSCIYEFGGAYHVPVDDDSIIRNSQIYNRFDIECIDKGMEFTSNYLLKVIGKVNLVEEGKIKFNIPIIFLGGKYDYIVPAEVTLEYYEILDAPMKEFIWLNESAHFCYLEETENFINDLLYIKEKYYY
ncbi:MAG TPA: alpha/beta hydrolase [Patescibacteria group bacterium]|nr:alpha/beta hydrolase [Patescibacteria group bacterium]